jgi:hypothetical protein
MRTDFDCKLLCLPILDTLILTNYFWFEKRYTAGATGQQGMLTPRHLIPPPVYPGVRVSPFIFLTCNSYLCFETDLVHFFLSLFLNATKNIYTHTSTNNHEIKNYVSKYSNTIYVDISITERLK